MAHLECQPPGESSSQRGKLPRVSGDIDRILVSREQIAERIHQLGEEIARDLDELGPSAEIVLVPILTGSIIFVADLLRQLPQKIRLDVVTVSSYPGTSTRSKGASVVGLLPENVASKHVLIIDDILDSGNTIRLIRRELQSRNPLSVRTCVLLRKRIQSAMETPCEYVGFDIPDEFVVGYGLDYDHYYRNLPYIGCLRREAL